ncbi:MAG: MarC family protein [Marinilabiliales bacterium]
MKIDLLEIASAFMVLFAVIDIVGSIPIIIKIKEKEGVINSEKTTIIAFVIMLLFLLIGEPLLKLFGVDIPSFAIAGSFVIFFLSLEMVLGIEFFKTEINGSSEIVPLAFPIIAGAGSITTLLSIRAEYELINIIIALILNMIFVYFVLKTTRFFEKILGKTGTHILRKVFGIILLAIAIKLFLSNTGINLSHAAGN